MPSMKRQNKLDTEIEKEREQETEKSKESIVKYRNRQRDDRKR